MGKVRAVPDAVGRGTPHLLAVQGAVRGERGILPGGGWASSAPLCPGKSLLSECLGLSREIHVSETVRCWSQI